MIIGLRRVKADLTWSSKPANEFGLDVASNPKLSPRFGESTRSRLFFSFRCPLAQVKGVAHGGSVYLLCRFGRPQGMG